MTARPELERLVSDWLADDASASSSNRVLAAALDRIETTRQERHLTQRLFGDRLGRSRTVRVALTVAAAILLLAGAVSAAGSFWRLPAPPFEGRNGWIAFSTSDAGRDIYFATESGMVRRPVGSEGDGVDQGCQRFGRDGRSLAYVEITFPSDTARSWSAVVVEIDADGRLGSERARLIVPGPLVSCPVWSPDVTRIAWAASPNEGADVLVADLDGTRTTLMRGLGVGPAVDAGGEVAAWSPDGTSLAVLRSSPDPDTSAIWFVPADGSPPRVLVAGLPGRRIEGVSWSPDGSRLGLRTIDVPTDVASVSVVDVATGRPQLTERADDPGVPVWSLDGTRIAYVANGRVVVSASDGSDRTVLPQIVLDVPAYARAVTWAPDGTRLLVTVGDATFVDRGVRFALVSIDPAGTGPQRVISRWKSGFYTDLAWQDLPR
jgi:Tol biopolymer transport system component